MATPNPNFDAIKSTTLKNYRKKFADNVTNGNELLRYMKTKGSMIEDGGDTLVEELMYGTTNGGSYSGTDTMNIDIPEGLTAAEYNWKEYYETIAITGTEKLKNSGEAAMQKLLKARTKQAEIGMANRLGQHLYLDGTGNGGKDILGLAAIVDTDPTTGVLGGIDRAQFPFWRNYTNTAVGSFANFGLAAISTAIRALTRGKDRPTVMFMGSTVYGYLQAVASNRAQFNNPEMAGLNFNALKVEGIDAVYDPQCTADRIYLLNLDYLKFVIHKDRNFVMKDFIEPADQEFEVAKYLFAGQLVTSNASLQGVLSGITA